MQIQIDLRAAILIGVIVFFAVRGCEKVPGPAPGPEPTGIAKAVADAAEEVASPILRQAAGAYGSQVSAINAGAYDSLELNAAKQQIVDAIKGDNPQRRRAPELFDTIDRELQALEEADELGSLTAVSAALAQVVTGLESALE